jgi:hypothetical protein
METDVPQLLEKVQTIKHYITGEPPSTWAVPHLRDKFKERLLAHLESMEVILKGEKLQVNELREEARTHKDAAGEVFPEGVTKPH